MSACACCDRLEGVGTYGQQFPVCFSCYASGRLKAALAANPEGPRLATHTGLFLPFAPVLMVADTTGRDPFIPRWGLLGRVLLGLCRFTQDAQKALASEYGEGHEPGYSVKLRELQKPVWRW